jgi:hypothetical protein
VSGGGYVVFAHVGRSGPCHSVTESFPLLLPSALTPECRSAACEDASALQDEIELREAAAHQALDNVRRHLMARTALYGHKRANGLTVAQLLKSQSAINSCSAQVMLAYARYQHHWGVLDSLQPLNANTPFDPVCDGWRRDLQELKVEHLTGLNTNEAELQEQDSIARAKVLASTIASEGTDGTATPSSDAEPALRSILVFEELYQHSQRRRQISWIWPQANMSEGGLGQRLG